MNGAPLPIEYGAPLRLRVETQLGFKMVKWITAIEFVADTGRRHGHGRMAGGPDVLLDFRRDLRDVVGTLRGAPVDASRAPHVLREYALIADGERGALVGPPRRHLTGVRAAVGSDGVFSSLIGGGGASPSLPPEPMRLGRALRGEARSSGEGAGSPTTGVVECRDALARPAERGARRSLVRRVVPTKTATSRCG